MLSPRIFLLSIRPNTAVIDGNIFSPDMSTTPPGPPRAFVISQPPMVTSCPGYKASESKNLGIAVLVMAVLSVGFGIASLIIELDYNCYNNFCANVGSGIWCGFFVSKLHGNSAFIYVTKAKIPFTYVSMWVTNAPKVENENRRFCVFPKCYFFHDNEESIVTNVT